MIAYDLPMQTPINPAADRYAQTSLLRSSGVPRLADMAFGPDPSQRLDVYLPEFGAGPQMRWPVFLFWHGGGHTHGHKEWCGFMAPPLTALPAVFISANYRLMPHVGAEAQMDDARAALRWVMDHIARLGGNPDHIVVGGHSAGGNIAARLELDAPRRRAAGIPDGTIKAVLPLSGSYFTQTSSRSPARPVVDESMPDCPARFAHPGAAPFTVAWGTRERDPLPADGAAFAAHLRQQGLQAADLPVEGMDHFGVHLAAAEPRNLYFRAVAQAIIPAKAPE